MKIKHLLIWSCFSLSLTQGDSVICGRIDYGNNEIFDSSQADKSTIGTPVRKVIKNILSIYAEEFQGIDYLDFSKNTIQASGFKIIVEELIPKLPNLKILNLSYNTIGEKGLDPLYDLLNNNNKLQYIAIFGNGLARTIVKKLQQDGYPNDIGQKIANKVIVVPQSMFEEFFSSSIILKPFFENWYQTHKKYFQSQHDNIEE